MEADILSAVAEAPRDKSYEQRRVSTREHTSTLWCWAIDYAKYNNQLKLFITLRATWLVADLLGSQSLQ